MVAIFFLAEMDAGPYHAGAAYVRMVRMHASYILTLHFRGIDDVMRSDVRFLFAPYALLGISLVCFMKLSRASSLTPKYIASSF